MRYEYDIITVDNKPGHGVSLKDELNTMAKKGFRFVGVVEASLVCRCPRIIMEREDPVPTSNP